MERSDILAKVVEQVSDILSVDVSDVTEATSFDDYDVDSIDRLEVLVALEDEFGIEIDADDATKFKTIGDLVDAIAKLV